MDSQADQQGVCVQGAAGVVEGMEVEVKMDEGGGREGGKQRWEGVRRVDYN